MKNNAIWEALSHVNEEYVEEASPDGVWKHRQAIARKKRIPANGHQ